MASAKKQFSFISASNERISPLLNGDVEVEGAELVWTNSDPSETFWRQLKFEEFEVCEMSFSSLLIALANGVDMVAIPVFPSRRFMHALISFHVDSGVEKPNDLNGKRIGVGEYQQTASLWLRGVLQHDFGVDQFSVDWYMERSPELSHGGATGFKPMDGIKFHQIPNDKSLATMLAANELDAAPIGRAFSNEKNIIDRSTTIRPANADWSKVKPLFPDLMAEGARFFNEHGYIPANHCYAIRGDVYRANPWLAFNLYSAFVRAKEAWYAQLNSKVPSDLIFGPQYMAQTRAIFGSDPYPYGIKDNAKMMETMISFSHEQGFIPRKLEFEEIFAKNLLDL
jgi:4,5-dihydroxyphthalate decarboxylase